MKIAEEALIAEQMGFDSLWFPDNLVSLQSPSGRLEAWTMLSFLASRTKRISLVSAVSDIYRRHPATLAHMALTLDLISHGRAMLGIGTGHAANLAEYGFETDKPVAKLREAISLLRLLFHSSLDEPIDFQGDFFRARGAFLEIARMQAGGPPIYVGAQSPRIAILAGEMADGWFPWLHTVEGFKEMAYHVDEGAKKSGRDTRNVDKVAHLFSLISDDESEALNLIGRRLKLSLVLERNILAKEGLCDNLPIELQHLRFTASEANYAMLSDFASSIPDSIVNKVAVIGKPDAVISTIEKYVESGSSHVVLRPFNRDDLILIGKKVLPYFAR